MVTPVDVKFIPIINASLLGSFGDQGLFGAANILKIADFVCQVVFLLFLPCF